MIQGNIPTKIPVAVTPITKVDPEYPRPALEAHVQGTVVLWAVINKEGHVEGFNQVRGPGLLVKAAQDAVYQWVFEPTVLNGSPVSVVRYIAVPFVLLAAK